jgi:hypothetical protein
VFPPNRPDEDDRLCPRNREDGRSGINTFAIFKEFEMSASDLDTRHGTGFASTPTKTPGSTSQPAPILHWPDRCSSPGGVRRSGWLIARIDQDPASRSAGSPRDSPRCLQLATGQWCDPANATWFPVSSAAILYASDLASFKKTGRFGHRIGVIFLEQDGAPDKP